MIKDVGQRVLVVSLILGAAVLSLLPTALRDSFTSQWFTKPIALGLDISGGVHLVYGVQAKEAVKSRLQNNLTALRTDLRGKKIAVAQAGLVGDTALQITLLSESSTDAAKSVIQEKYGTDLSFVKQDLDAGRPRLVFEIPQKKVEQIQRDAIDQSVETLRARVDQFGVSEPLIQRSGEDRIILQMPGVSDIASVKKVVGSVAKLEFRMVPQGASSTVGTVTLKDQKGTPITLEDQVVMTGDSVVDARVDFEDKGKIGVSLTLSSSGRSLFSKITSEHVGQQMAIILDGVVQTAPVINEPITGGQAFISGSYSLEEARQLKVVLKAGALPAPLEVLEERTVGPTLGLESIKSGLLAMAIGCLAISVFMMIYYRLAGVVAVVTLILNGVLMLAALSLFGATLTLPGLAGLALTIGMAVDSNVIIFERIRDEIRSGSARDLAVNLGFEKAFGAIFDANVTTLLSGVILYYFGTGAVKGFAVTLCIGIATTLFCAVYVGRLFFDYFSLTNKKGLSI